jgi:hypothetical protein
LKAKKEIRDMMVGERDTKLLEKLKKKVERITNGVNRHRISKKTIEKKD